MTKYNSVTFRILPYLYEDESYFDNGREYAWKAMKKSLTLFKNKYGVEWSYGSGDSYIMDMSINMKDTRKSLPVETIEAFKLLTRTFGRLYNEIYFPVGHYQWHKLKTFEKYGYTHKTYWTDRNQDQYRKVAGTRMYWSEVCENGKQYRWSYFGPRYH